MTTNITKQIILLSLAISTLSSCLKLNSYIVNEEEYLGNETNPQEIYKAQASDSIIVPFSFDFAIVDKMFFCAINDDDRYDKFELQLEGDAPLVIAFHKNGKVDKYFSSKVRHITAFHNGVNIIENTEIAYTFETTDSEFTGAFEFTDKFGDNISIKMNQKLDSTDIYNLLPLLNSKPIAPLFFPFFYLKDMTLARDGKTYIEIAIGGKKREPAYFPLKIDGQKSYLAFHTTKFIETEWNKNYSGNITPVKTDTQKELKTGNIIVHLNKNGKHNEILQLSGKHNGQVVRIKFQPAIPDLLALKEGTETSGKFSSSIGDIRGVFAGKYKIKCSGKSIHIQLLPSRNYQPGPPIIRNSPWVAMYEWNAEILRADNKYELNSAWKVAE